jgi:hypothetical protein
MKQYLFFIVFLSTSFGVQAQTEKGRWMLSLHNFAPLISESSLLAPTNSFGIGFGNTVYKNDVSNQEESTDFTSVGLEANMHYFLLDNLSAGVNLGLFSQTVDDENLTAFLAGPELRYYFPMGSNRLYIRGGAAWGSFEYEGAVNPTHLQQYEGGVAFALFLSKNFSANVGFGYGVNIAKEEYTFLEATYHDVTTTNRATIDVGFAYFFGAGNE